MVKKDSKSVSTKKNSAVKKPVKVLGTILLYVRIGDLHVKVWFGIVENLATGLLLGTLLINWFIHRIFPGKRYAVP